MLYEYNTNNIEKNENGKAKLYKQVNPFTNGVMYDNPVNIGIFGKSAVFYSENTKQILGISDISTVQGKYKLFKEV